MITSEDGGLGKLGRASRELRCDKVPRLVQHAYVGRMGAGGAFAAMNDGLAAGARLGTRRSAHLLLRAMVENTYEAGVEAGISTVPARPTPELCESGKSIELAHNIAVRTSGSKQMV